MSDDALVSGISESDPSPDVGDVVIKPENSEAIATAAAAAAAATYPAGAADAQLNSAVQATAGHQPAIAAVALQHYNHTNTGTAVATTQEYQHNASNVSQWSKNGFGDSVAKQSGKFSKEESELVKAAIEEYCSTKQISVTRLCSECDHKAELKGAWMEIAKRLPNRSVQSVYRHGIRQCHPFKRGAWSEGECSLLHELVARLGKKWSTIQSKLNRSADSCRDKYREMSDDYVKGRWKDEETEELKRVIREQLHVPATMSMKNLGKLTEEQNIQIPWSIISKRMGKRSRLSCFKKWQKMTGLTGSSAEEFAKEEAVQYASAEDPTRLTKRPRLDDAVAAAAAASTAATIAQASAAAAHTAATQLAREALDECHDQHPVDDYSNEADIFDSAKMAAETVEAVDLPDTDALVGHTTTTIHHQGEYDV